MSVHDLMQNFHHSRFVKPYRTARPHRCDNLRRRHKSNRVWVETRVKPFALQHYADRTRRFQPRIVDLKGKAVVGEVEVQGRVYLLTAARYRS